MVPTRQRSTVYRRSIRAASSIGMVMSAAPANAARAQPAQSHMRQQPVSAAPAYQCCEWDRAGVDQPGVGRRIDADGELADARYVACGQWSIGVRDRATLVRHFIDGVAQRTPPFAPARGTRGMPELTAPTALVALCSLLSSFKPTHARARPAAILLTAVAVRTQQHLIATTRAQEQAGRTVHVHPRAKPKVLDGLVPGCNTAAAPPSSARCRARRGLQASRP
jgi:hypothetical protein